ncbi:hypothetical protein BH10ACT3_BH10ACT3_00670 [soil metagenome]
MTDARPMLERTPGASYNGPSGAPQPNPGAGSVRRIAEYVVFASMSWLVWFWVTAVIVWAVIVGVIIESDTLGDSVWEEAGLGWTRWVLFAAGVVMATQSIPVLVAHGVTRRRVWKGALVGLTIVGVVGAVVVTAVHLLEGVVYRWDDAVHVVGGWHLYDDPGQIHLVLLESFLIYLGYAISGWIVGLGYYRFGGILGTLALPFGLLPIAAIELSLNSTIEVAGLDLTTDMPMGVRALVCLLAIVSGAAAAFRLQREMALRPRPH